MTNKMDRLRKIASGRGLEKKALEDEPHLRWNMQTQISDNPEMVRYYFAFVGSSIGIDKMKNQLYSDLRSAGGAIEKLRDDFGRVNGTNLSYELNVVESRAHDSIVKRSKLGVPKVLDDRMYERVRKSYTRKSDGVGQEFSVERYIADLYNR